MFKPLRLLVNELQTGEYEFSAHFEYSPNDYEDNAQFRWQIRSNDSWGLRTKGVLLPHDPDSSKHIHMAAVLPPSWDGGKLLLEIGDTRGLKEFATAVDRYDQPVDLILPLSDSALTAVGHSLGEAHRTAIQIPSQQFGWDFLGLGKRKLSIVDIQAPSLSASDFSGFGSQVISPAVATVYDAKGGQEDVLEIGVMPQDLSFFTENLMRALGNYVILEHSPEMYSVLAHLQRGSLKVEKGQRVAAGDPIAALGNSGYSSGPHLHFHVMDGPDILTSSPLPVVLHLEDGVFDPRGGDIISNA